MSLPPAVECWLVGLAGFIGGAPRAWRTGLIARLLTRLLARLAERA